MTHEEAVNRWAESWPKIVARTWLEPAFRRRLLKEPANVLAEHGIPAVEGLDVQVVPGHARTQVTSKGPNATLVLRLPDKPKGFDEEDVSSLESVTGPLSLKGCFCFCGGGKPGGLTASAAPKRSGGTRKTAAKRAPSAKSPTGGGKGGRTAKKASRK